MKAIMEKLGIQIMILTLCTVAAIPRYFFDDQNTIMDTAAFVLVKKVEDVSLYEKWNKLDSNVLAREVKAVFTVQADVNAVVALIKDESHAMEWNKNSSAYTVIGEGRSHWVCHIQYDLPWPVSNQDCVLQYAVHQTPDTLTITFESVAHPLFPIQPGVTRIPGVQGKWVLRKAADGTRVDYFITTIPSRTFPRWITDPIIRNNLLNTMIAFRELLKN